MENEFTSFSEQDRNRVFPMDDILQFALCLTKYP
jgi:hypothetical protein